MSRENFQWSAFDPQRWDHYYHAGQQVRFYRQQPAHLIGGGFQEAEPRWIDRVIRFFNPFF